MDMTFKCPACGQELEVDESAAGEEIECPACNQRIQIPGQAPGSPPVAAPAPATPAGGWASGGAASPIASSAAAKEEKHLVVPVHEKPQEKLIAKAAVPLEIAAKETDRHLRVKCIRRVECAEVGHDNFDKVVSEFLAKIGERNFISITTLSYSHIDISSQKLLNDYGVMILYRG